VGVPGSLLEVSWKVYRFRLLRSLKLARSAHTKHRLHTALLPPPPLLPPSTPSSAAASLTKEMSSVLEVDRDDSPPRDGAGGWTVSAMRATIDGESHVPLRMFAYSEGNVGRAVRVAQDMPTDSCRGDRHRGGQRWPRWRRW